MKLTLQQLEAHLWGAANILRGKTAGQDYKNYILSLMFYKRLGDQWECEADHAVGTLAPRRGAFAPRPRSSSVPSCRPLHDVELGAPLSAGSGEGQRRRVERCRRWSEGGVQSSEAGCRT